MTPSAVNLDFSGFSLLRKTMVTFNIYTYIFLSISCTCFAATNRHLGNYFYYTSGRSSALSGSTFSMPPTVYRPITAATLLMAPRTEAGSLWAATLTTF